MCWLLVKGSTSPSNEFLLATGWLLQRPAAEVSRGFEVQQHSLLSSASSYFISQQVENVDQSPRKVNAH